MSLPSQAPFARLVKYIEGALRTTALISIPADILAAFKETCQPLDDTGLRDLVKLFNTSHQGNRSCLEAITLSQLVQITFRLQPSLLQHNLIYSLLLPPKVTGVDAYISWQKSVSGRLVPTLLRLLEEGRLPEDLLVTTDKYEQAAHSLYLWIAGHEEAKSAVYSGQEALRRALGTLVIKCDNYVLKIVVANLIRELLTDRSDRYLFWPRGTPGISFNEFPLSRLGDAQWLAKAIEFLSVVSASKTFRADLPEVYRVQHSESKHSVAIITDNITIVLPATTKQPLRFLQLPLIDGMVCQSMEDVNNDVTVQYRRTTGYHISQGVKRAADDIHLAFGDPAQSVAFAESVHSRVAKKLADTSSNPQPKTTTQRSSYARIDLTRSSETSFESEDGTNHLAHVPESRASISLPSCAETQGAPRSPKRQERVTDISPHLPQAQISPISRFPPTHETPKVPLGLQAIHKHQASKESREHEFAGSAIRADEAATETMTDSRRQLKRPSAKEMGVGNRDDIDWDEDLRDDGVELEKPTLKKAKTTSTKAKTAKKATTGKTSQLGLKGDDKEKKATKSKARGLSGKTAETTWTRRAATARSSKYVKEPQINLEDDSDDQPSPVMRDSKPSTSKQTLSMNDEVHIDDSQSLVSDKGMDSPEQDSIRNLHHTASSPASPELAQKLKITAQEEVANDSYPMETTAKAGALAKNNTSFGTKIAQTLATKAHLPVTAVEQQSRKSFGDVKKFVETVNVTRKSSPPKNPAKESQDVQLKPRKATVGKPASGDRRPTDGTAQHSLAQFPMAKPSKPWPETDIDYTRPAEGQQKHGSMPTAHKEQAPISIRTENSEQGAPARVHSDDLKEATPTKIPEDDREEEEACGIPKDNPDLANFAVKHIIYQKTVVTAITSRGDSDDENQVEKLNGQDESPEPKLSRPAITSTEWFPSERKSQKVLQEIPKGAIAETPMDPPPLPRRSERRSVQSPVNVASDDGKSSLPVADERIQRKTPIVSFGAKGPRNQGVVSPNKQPEFGDASVLVPPEIRTHSAAKRQKKWVQSEPIKLPELATIDDGVSGSCSEIIENDEQILTQEENAPESGAVGESPDVNYEDEGILVQQERAVEQIPVGDAISRENASQSSRVDENGSPRLHQTRKSLNFASNLQATSITPEQSKSSAFESEELGHSAYTEPSSSSPAVVRPQMASTRITRPPKAKIIHTRPSIGLQDVVSENFPEAPKSVNIAAFKNKATSTLSKPPVVIEKANTVIRKARRIPQPETSLHLQTVQVETNHAAPSPSIQPPFSDPNTHVTRLSPKISADSSKALKGASPRPTSFKTGFKNMLMPPPPLPRLRHEQSDLTAATVRQGMSKSDRVVEDEDLTLINVEDSVEHGRPVRSTTRHQRQQSPDSSTDSQSSPMPEHVQLKSEKRNGDQEASLPELRLTQQNIRNVMNRAATGVLFRLQVAEQAIQIKTQEYHSGCYTIINNLETTHRAQAQHEKAKAAPRVAVVWGTYNTTIENCSKGLRRVRGGLELSSLSEKNGKRRNYLLSLMGSQMDEAGISEKETEWRTE